MYCTYRMDQVPNPEPHLHRFAFRQELLDPYAKMLQGGRTWGISPSEGQNRRRSLIVHEVFDWGDDEPPLYRSAAEIGTEETLAEQRRYPVGLRSLVALVSRRGDP